MIWLKFKKGFKPRLNVKHNKFKNLLIFKFTEENGDAKPLVGGHAQSQIFDAVWKCMQVLDQKTNQNSYRLWIGGQSSETLLGKNIQGQFSFASSMERGWWENGIIEEKAY